MEENISYKEVLEYKKLKVEIEDLKYQLLLVKKSRKRKSMFLLKFILFFACFPLFVLVWLLSE
jgi:hypothetical protein